jgi:hypothetical protein
MQVASPAAQVCVQAPQAVPAQKPSAQAVPRFQSRQPLLSSAQAKATPSAQRVSPSLHPCWQPPQACWDAQKPALQESGGPKLRQP